MKNNIKCMCGNLVVTNGRWCTKSITVATGVIVGTLLFVDCDVCGQEFFRKPTDPINLDDKPEYYA